MTQCHDTPAAGHFGLFKTLDLVSRTFWWPRLQEDVQSYVATCERCRAAKSASGAPPGLLQPLPTPTRPWGAISIDFVTHLPVSSRFTTVMVVMDMLTKMVHFIPCRQVPTAQTTAQLFVQQVFRLHGLPDRVVSDRGTQFTSRFWRELMSALQVQVCLASTQHPQTDGGTEKTIGILEQYLRCFVSDRQADWSCFLPVAEFAFNNSRHSSTKLTPFYANYGLHPRFFPLTLLDSPVPAAEDFLSELQAVHEVVKRHLIKAKEDYKRFADRSRRDVPPLAVGDRVWLSTKHIASELPRRKLDPRFLGPFPIEQVINPVAYRLTLPASLHAHPVFHRSLLVPARPDCPLRPSVPVLPAPCVRDHLPDIMVHAIRDSRWMEDCFQYLVQWVEGDPDDCSWVEAALVDAPNLIRAFHLQFPQKPRPLRWSRGRGLPGGDSVVIGPEPAAEQREVGVVQPESLPIFMPSDSDTSDSLSEVSEEEGVGCQGGVADSPPDSLSSLDSDAEEFLDMRKRRASQRKSQLKGYFKK